MRRILRKASSIFTRLSNIILFKTSCQLYGNDRMHKNHSGKLASQSDFYTYCFRCYAMENVKTFFCPVIYVYFSNSAIFIAEQGDKALCVMMVIQIAGCKACQRFAVE